MSTTTAAIKASYPLPAYNYRVTVLDNGVPSVIGFSEVTGLAVEHEQVTYKHGLSFATGSNLIAGMRQPIRLTLKKGIVQRVDFLQQWMTKSYSEPFSAGAKRDVVIDLCDERGLPVVRWQIRGALPVKLEAPAFSASAQEAAVLSMDLVAGDVSVDYHPA